MHDLVAVEERLVAVEERLVVIEERFIVIDDLLNSISFQLVYPIIY